jgi:hypothetical protein
METWNAALAGIMAMVKQHVHGTLTCRMDMDMHHGDMDMQPCFNIIMQYGHGQEARTWTCTVAWTWKGSTDMRIQHGHGHAVWTWACSIETDMWYRNGQEASAWTCGIDIGMQHIHGHVAWPWTSSME